MSKGNKDFCIDKKDMRIGFKNPMETVPFVD